MKKVIFLFCCALASLAQAQTLERIYPPIRKNAQILPNATAGGTNAPQFSAADLNNDGLKDLVVFDRVGEIFTTYLNNGSTSAMPYRLAPEYAKNFPKCSYWSLLRDFNCDGIADMYTNRPNGVRVYRGYYQNNQLKFALRNDYLLYNDPYTLFDTNLYVNQIDIPNISDMDNDGDLDIAVFSAGGSYVDYYKNVSIEMGYGCDSLYYKMVDDCWGRFQESQLNSTITLSPRKDSCLGRADYLGGRHPGSTLTCFDADGDQDKDALVGDISGYSLLFLRNGLNKDTAYFNFQSPQYPAPNGATNLAFPAAYFLDTNNDGKRDLIVATNEVKINENYLVYEYRNIGTDNAPIFQLNTDAFLSNAMIDIGSQAVPVAFDYNNDGKLDLLVGGYGRYRTTGTVKYRSTLQLFQNVGTAAAPAFDLVNDDWQNLSVQNYYGLLPTIGDIDGDGDKDIVLGNEDGNLILLENQGWNGSAYTFSAPINNWLGIDVGVASAPELADVNQDGKNDLIIGERQGNLNYYKNNGGGTFALVTDAFGSVDGRNQSIGYNAGFTVPRFYTNDAGVYQLLVGTEAGNIQRYGNILGNLAGSFVKIDSAFANIYMGNNSAPCIADFNGDEINDFVIGNRRGGIAFYSGAAWTATEKMPTADAPRFLVYPNPAQQNLSISIENPNASTQVLYLYNELGQTVRTQTTTQSTTIMPIHDLPDGIYYLSLHYNTQVITQKVVILR
jgi:Secretion system C-terminal sorting domain/FG-GAP-like repeat